VTPPARFRAMLAADLELGAGNVLLRLAEHGADLDEPRVAFDTPVDGFAPFTLLSLRDLTRLAAARADWFRAKGIGRRDPVALYVTDAADVFLNFFALCRLGAIPALMNGNMPLEVAVTYIQRLRCSGVVTDAAHAQVARWDLGAPVLGDAAETGTRRARRSTSATPATTRSRSPTPPARRGCRPRSCTRTTACSRRSARSGSPSRDPTETCASCPRCRPRMPPG
jgi:acyl-CoA synthetase (AMP-forming)/AMP-acid ligase II